MKTSFAIVTVVFVLVLTGFSNHVDPVHISGRLERPPHDKKGRSFEIIVKSDISVVATTNTKITGEFELSFTPSNEKYFDFFYIDPRKKADTVFLISFSHMEPGMLQIKFNTSRKYYVDDDNHVVCPKCGQSENVNKEPVYYYCSKDRIKF